MRTNVKRRKHVPSYPTELFSNKPLRAIGSSDAGLACNVFFAEGRVQDSTVTIKMTMTTEFIEKRPWSMHLQCFSGVFCRHRFSSTYTCERAHMHRVLFIVILLPVVL